MIVRPSSRSPWRMLFTLNGSIISVVWKRVAAMMLLAALVVLASKAWKRSRQRKWSGPGRRRRRAGPNRSIPRRLRSPARKASPHGPTRCFDDAALPLRSRGRASRPRRLLRITPERAGARYLAEFEQVPASIAEGLHRFPCVGGSRIRRAHLHRFPSTLRFRESGTDLQILAVAHKRRRPTYWFPRILP